MVKSVWLSMSLVALVAMPPVAKAGWVIEWRSTPIRKDIRQDSSNSTAYIDDNKSRMEQEHLTSIYDYDKSTFTILNPKAKYFWSGSVEDYVKLSAKRRHEATNKHLGAASKAGADPLPELDLESLPEITVELSGEAREIAGHQTTKYLVKLDNEIFQEFWVAPDVDLTADLDPEKLVEFQKKSSRGMIGAAAKPYNALYRSPAYLDLLRKGYALETKTNHIAGSFEQRARSIRETTVDPARFAVPEGYRRVRLEDVFKVEED